MLLLLSTDPSEEPRMQIDDTPKSQMVFGVTVDGLKPGEPVIVDEKAFGYPIRSLRDVPPGEYYVQALLNVYETFHRADGKTIKLAPDRGEGQHWNLAPGNLYSKPVKITLGKSGAPVKISLDQEIPPIPTPSDTKYRPPHSHPERSADQVLGTSDVSVGDSAGALGLRRASRRALSAAAVSRPLCLQDFDDFRTEPPDPNLKPDYSERFHISGYNRIQQEEAYKFYQQWISPNFPRYLVVKLQHANPYYDDSYAVNSANLGPYGDAIETELMPAIEKKFRSHSARAGRASPTAARPADGSRWRCRSSIPTTTTACSAPVPTRSTFAPTPSSISTKIRTRSTCEGAHKRVEQPAMRNYLGHTLITIRGQQRLRTRAGRSWPLGRAVGHLAGGVRPGGQRWLPATYLQ